jgi:DnaD/phage-associated family protein
MFTRWTQTYGYDTDIIRIAYDITVNAIQKPVPKYADKIIEKWYSEGLRTLADIEAFESKKKDMPKDNGEVQKSYEIDDFFAAALNRSLKDLK